MRYSPPDRSEISLAIRCLSSLPVQAPSWFSGAAVEMNPDEKRDVGRNQLVSESVSVPAPRELEPRQLEPTPVTTRSADVGRTHGNAEVPPINRNQNTDWSFPTGNGINGGKPAPTTVRVEFGATRPDSVTTAMPVDKRKVILTLALPVRPETRMLPIPIDSDSTVKKPRGMCHSITDFHASHRYQE